MTHTFDELEQLLHAHSADKIIPGLERITRILERLGNPQDTFKAVHIVGTNGKGSTGAFISSVLKASGYRTAFYSSPHLESLGERLLIDGAQLSPDEWLSAAHEAVSVIRPDEDMPSYFELLTASAFILMRRAGVEVGVIEAGMGGRFDATNVMRNVLCSVIAEISMDHLEYLGSTIEEIAREKFAVVREGGIAVYSGRPKELADMFMGECEVKRAEGYVAGLYGGVGGVKVSESVNVFDFVWRGKGRRVEWRGVRTGLIGTYQIDNAVLALCALALMMPHLTSITESSIKEGMRDAVWSGRLEVIGSEPVVVLDGGHNYGGVASLCRSIRELWPGKSVSVVYAAMRDKDYAGCLGLLSEELGHPKLYVTAVPGMARSATPDELLAEAIEHEWGNEPEWYASPMDAVNAARESGSDVVVICGSLYLVGYMRSRVVRR